MHINEMLCPSNSPTSSPTSSPVEALFVTTLFLTIVASGCRVSSCCLRVSFGRRPPVTNPYRNHMLRVNVGSGKAVNPERVFGGRLK